MAKTNERALTKQQQAFVDAYICDPEMNATDCVRKAYPKTKYPDKVASQLLGNTRVAKAIKKAQDARAKRTEITADRVLREYAKIGFSNIADYLKVERREVETELGTQTYKTVDIFETDHIDRDKLDAVAEIKQTKDGISLKLHDKKGALDSIAKHLGMFTDTSININLNNLSDEEIDKILSDEQ